MATDTRQRLTLACTDDNHRQSLVTAARRIIYERNLGVNSSVVENLLQETSLVPNMVHMQWSGHTSYRYWSNIHWPNFKRIFRQTGLSWLLSIPDVGCRPDAWVWVGCLEGPPHSPYSNSWITQPRKSHGWAGLPVRYFLPNNIHKYDERPKV